MNRNNSNGTLCKQLSQALTLAMDMDKERKAFHSWRVALLALRMAEDITPEKKNLLFYCALIHDLGGIGIPCSQLQNGKVSSQVKNHPLEGGKLARLIPGLKQGALYIEEHHERWDGTGFPYGMKGKEMTGESQILQTADYVDIVLRRPLNGSLAYALEILKQGAGKVFNPSHMKLLRQVFQREDLARVFLWAEHPEGYFKRAVEETSWPLSKKNISNRKLLYIFARLIDTKHRHTLGHSLRVARFCYRIGEEMGIDKKNLDTLEAAALLHDLGKLALPVQLLDKHTPLMESEYEQVKKHPRLTGEIICHLSALAPASFPAACHHEWWNGKGYPYGLKQEEIPLLARVIAVADAYDAMTTVRPYRVPLTSEEAEAKLLAGAGVQFDPQVVEVFLHKVLLADQHQPGANGEKYQTGSF